MHILLLILLGIMLAPFVVVLGIFVYIALVLVVALAIWLIAATFIAIIGGIVLVKKQLGEAIKK